MKNLQHVS